MGVVWTFFPSSILSLFFLPLFGRGPGGVAQSVGHLTRKSGVLGSIPGLATYFRFSFRFFKKAVVSYWRKYVHKVLVNRLGGLSLPRKSVVRLTDRPDMTLDVYRGRKTTMQQQHTSCLLEKTMVEKYGGVPIHLLHYLDH